MKTNHSPIKYELMTDVVGGSRLAPQEKLATTLVRFGFSKPAAPGSLNPETSRSSPTSDPGIDRFHPAARQVAFGFELPEISKS